MVGEQLGRKCKGPEAGMFLAYLRKSIEASVVDWSERGRVGEGRMRSWKVQIKSAIKNPLG